MYQCNTNYIGINQFFLQIKYMSLEVLEQYKNQIQKIITAEDEAVDVVVSTLKSLPPVIRAVPVAARTAAKTGKVSEQDALEITSVIALLVILNEDEGFSNEELINLVNDFVEQDNELSNFSKDVLARFKNRLINLIKDTTSLRISYKASKLLGEHERILSSVKIVTDSRPIFNDAELEGVNAETKTIEGFAITHNMKIEYRDREGLKEFHVALDSVDLNIFHDEIVNAIENNNSLKSMFKKSEIICIDLDLDSYEED